MAYGDSKHLVKEQCFIKYCMIKHLMLQKLQNMMDIRGFASLVYKFIDK